MSNQFVESFLQRMKQIKSTPKRKITDIDDQNKSKRARTSPIDNLPVELLTHTFSFLDVKSLFHVSLVCSFWKEITNIPSVWENQVIVIKKSLKDMHDIPQPQRYHRLVVSRMNQLIKVTETCSNLTHLAAFMKTYNYGICVPYSLDNVPLERCQKLSNLILFNVSYDSAIHKLPSNLETIKCNTRTARLDKLLQQCPKLISVECEYNNSIRGLEDIINYGNPAMKRLSLVLNISELLVGNVSTWMKFEAVAKKLPAKFPELEELILIEHGTDKTFISFAAVVCCHLPSNLKTVTIQTSQALTIKRATTKQLIKNTDHPIQLVIQDMRKWQASDPYLLFQDFYQ